MLRWVLMDSGQSCGIAFAPWALIISLIFCLFVCGASIFDWLISFKVCSTSSLLICSFSKWYFMEFVPGFFPFLSSFWEKHFPHKLHSATSSSKLSVKKAQTLLLLLFCFFVTGSVPSAMTFYAKVQQSMWSQRKLDIARPAETTPMYVN